MSVSLDVLDTSLFKTPSGAILDETRMYRYRLWREIPAVEGFVQNKGTVAFVMLNPSTADETEDDQTIYTCLALTGRWGYRRLVVVNLFAYRTKSPKELRKVKDRVKAIGPMNAHYIEHAALTSELVICAWGTNGSLMARASEVFDQLWDAHLWKGRPAPHYLKLSKHGMPEHPLYKPYTTTPKRFSVSLCGLPRPEPEDIVTTS